MRVWLGVGAPSGDLFEFTFPVIDAIYGAAHISFGDACAIAKEMLESDEVSRHFFDGQSGASGQSFGCLLWIGLGFEVCGVVPAQFGAEVEILFAEQVLIVALLIEKVADETREAEHLVGRGGDYGNGALFALRSVRHQQEDEQDKREKSEAERGTIENSREEP